MNAAELFAEKQAYLDQFHASGYPAAFEDYQSQVRAFFDACDSTCPAEEKNIEEFRRRLNVNCTLTDEELRPKIVIDVPMPVSYITKELVEQISLLEPFGKGNTKPVFAQKNLRVLDYSIIGKNKNVVKLKLLDPQGISVEGIYFGEAEDFVNFIREKDSISVTYYPEINRFRGRESLQIIIQNYC